MSFSTNLFTYRSASSNILHRPQEIRALGNSFGVFGWAVGCGSTTLAIPSMFTVLGYKALIVFGAFNFASLPLVYLFFPETKGRSLEEINLLFASPSPLASSNEAEYRRLLTDADGDIASAEYKLLQQHEGAGVGWETRLEQGSEEKGDFSKKI